ncbi:hypothetical protein M5K25_022697 [Dendrobium thyrsiflorum]|uniref:Uncharacterized protein n=1 Tax=Dendrobium thyrsiflorum TaxID=117978 RepID=A0ABD0UD17_DENTH
MIKRKEQVNELLSLSLLLSLLLWTMVKNHTQIRFLQNTRYVIYMEGALLRHQKIKEVEAKEGCSKDKLSELIKENIKSYDDHQKHITKIVSSFKHLSSIAERIVRESLKDEEIQKLNEENQKLTEDLNVIRKQYEEPEKRNDEKKAAEINKVMGITWSVYNVDNMTTFQHTFFKLRRTGYCGKAILGIEAFLSKNAISSCTFAVTNLPNNDNINNAN